MSRSYKKNPYCKHVSDPSYKKIFNKRIRRIKKFQDLPSGNSYKKANCSWDICDLKSYSTWKEYQDLCLKWDGKVTDEDKNYWEKWYKRK